MAAIRSIILIEERVQSMLGKVDRLTDEVARRAVPQIEGIFQNLSYDPASTAQSSVCPEGDTSKAANGIPHFLLLRVAVME